MATAPDPHFYQSRANNRINAAIQKIIEKASDEAFAEYGGRRVRFAHRWHSIDPQPTVIETAITNAYFDQGDDGGDCQLMFEVVVRDPRTGGDTTITRTHRGIEFI